MNTTVARNPTMIMDFSENPENFVKNTQDGAFSKVYLIKICSLNVKSVPSFIQPVLNKYADVFPDKLP